MKKKVAVLLGGWAAEREVSLSSGQGVLDALKDSPYDVKAIDPTPDLSAFIKELNGTDVVFNALHGPWGEDGKVQAILDSLNIPYTHSGVAASAVAMDKTISKSIFKAHNIPTPEWTLTTLDDLKKGHPMKPPYVLKPIFEGSSIGVYIVDETMETPPELTDWKYGDTILVERYIKGREIQVGVVNDKAIGTIELIPDAGFYDYAHKYTDDITTHVSPAILDPEIEKLLFQYTETAHHAMGCSDVSRTDFRFDPDLGKDGIFILELNTQPGLTPLSLLPEIAMKVKGISYRDLVIQMIENALK